MSIAATMKASLQRHPFIADFLLALAVLPIAVFMPDPDVSNIHDDVSTAASVFGAIACAAIVVRRRYPLAATGLSTVAVILAMNVSGGRATPAIVVFIALLTVAVFRSRRTALISGAIVGVLLTTAGYLTAVDPIDGRRSFGLLAWTAMSVAVGDAIRSRRAYVAEVEERARRAEESREEEARRRVVEERLHIARELHDVIAHHIAVVGVQAGAAGSLLDTDTDGARQALDHVRRASRTILDELNAMLGVLRKPDESMSLEPSPGLSNLPELLSSFVAAGLDVTVVADGNEQSLGETSDVVAYRVIQEALTNAHKHGTGSANLHLAFGDSDLVITVDNPVGSTLAKATNGYGLLGMQERTGAVGGAVITTVSSLGVFTVRAVLPMPHPPNRGAQQ